MKMGNVVHPNELSLSVTSRELVSSSQITKCSKNNKKAILARVSVICITLSKIL